MGGRSGITIPAVVEELAQSLYEAAFASGGEVHAELSTRVLKRPKDIGRREWRLLVARCWQRLEHRGLVVFDESHYGDGPPSLRIRRASRARPVREVADHLLADVLPQLAGRNQFKGVDQALGFDDVLMLTAMQDLEHRGLVVYEPWRRARGWEYQQHGYRFTRAGRSAANLPPEPLEPATGGPGIEWLNDSPPEAIASWIWEHGIEPGEADASIQKVLKRYAQSRGLTRYQERQGHRLMLEGWQVLEHRELVVSKQWVGGEHHQMLLTGKMSQ